MLRMLKAAIRKLPLIHEIVADRDRLHSELVAIRKNLRYVPPGHFYSPLPSLEDIRKDEARIFGPFPASIPGIDLHEGEQLKLLERLACFCADIPFGPSKREGLRYYFDNPSYSYSDAIFLYCMMRHLRPQRIIEVGSGFSSCVILDTNDLCFAGAIACVFIEPYPKLVLSLLTARDRDNSRLIRSRLQDVDLAEFEQLQANDILFIDSTHVSKIDSDVNRIFFEILPRLAPGVHIHFHDIFFPFEYPKEWVYEGRAWNEAYLLRAFLQFNRSFRIVLMNTFLELFHEEFFRKRMPLCLKNPGGSIWIRREQS